MTKTKNMYTQVSTREQAVIMLRSWLQAVNIEVHDAAGSEYDLAIVDANGSFVFAKVVQGKNTKAPADAIVIRAEELRCTRFSETHLKDTRTPRQIAFAAFHQLTEKAGYGSPIPFDRGAELDRKGSFEEDGWLVPFRHTEFRTAPNPPAEKYTRYKMILERQAYLFYVTNTDLCERNTHSLEDCRNLARFALPAFCAHHERPDDLNGENDKILTKYLKQRFAELRKSWMSEARRRSPDSGFVAIWSADDPGNDGEGGAAPLDTGRYGETDEYEHDHRETSMEDLVDMNLTTEDAFALRSEAEEEAYLDAAKNELATALAALPHDEMVEKLLGVVYSDEFDRETRRMAEKTLNAHCKKCSSCSRRSEVKEELASADAGCA